MSEREWILYILMEDRVLHAVFSCHSPGGPIASIVLDVCVTASFPLTLDIRALYQEAVSFAQQAEEEFGRAKESS
jgi:hypothetical protein